MKRNSPLDLSREIYLPRRISSNSKTVGFSRFSGDEYPVTPMDEIVYENLRSWEMTLVNFMGYNLNLNGDKINRFGPKSNPNRVDTWHDVGHTSNLNLSWERKGIRARGAHFS